MTTLSIRPGVPFPLGATWDGTGTNFALFSERADAVDLCLVDAHGHETVLRLPQREHHVWHGRVEGVGPGQLYGYRVHGPYAPEQGLRFNPRLRLLDPYAKAVSGLVDWSKNGFAFAPGGPQEDLEASDAEGAAAPLGVVIDPTHDWGDDRAPRTPLDRSVIYELHVKGFTQQHPEVPEELRGTYAALGHPAITHYLNELGVTAVELLPVHAFADDQHLLEQGLRNYWGYNTLNFFAPTPHYRQSGPPGDEVRQFREMVKALHRAGIEVILDVVYNHTAEGNHLGPTLSFKGIDNTTYYRLMPESRYFRDDTGTGNSLHLRHPQTLQLVMDSLRHWVTELHVDGFRFDLAPILARNPLEVDKWSGFFTAIHQDPVLSRVKMIGEPWDLGEGGYQVGNFPVRWSEWNGKYRDAMRAFWTSQGGGQVAELGSRLSGSSDLYDKDGRAPTASINFVTCHDGYTLHDLVASTEVEPRPPPPEVTPPEGSVIPAGSEEVAAQAPAELAQAEHARVEAERQQGERERAPDESAPADPPTPEIAALRRRQLRNFLATLMLSQGVPMFPAGDERGNSQGGDDNAYCRDEPLSWIDWRLDDERRALLEYTRWLIALRRAHPVLRRPRFFTGTSVRGEGASDVRWFRTDGAVMTDGDWHDANTPGVAMYLSGDDSGVVDAQGAAERDDDLLVLINGSGAVVHFLLPLGEDPRRWVRMLDTTDDAAPAIPATQPPSDHGPSAAAGEWAELTPRSLQLWIRPRTA